MQQQQGFLLAGSVYFGDVGATEYFYPAGESDKLETQPTNQAKTITSHQEGTYGQVVTSVILPQPTNIAISLFELNRQNLAKAFLGRDTDLVEVAETISMEKQLTTGQTLVLPHQLLSTIQVGTPAIASHTTGTVEDNNGLTWTAKAPGLSGNDVSITLTQPVTNNAVLTVSVVNKDVRVSLATSAEGAITSTSAQVLAAIQAHVGANRTISVAHTGASTGSGIVTAVTKTNLTGGLGYEPNIDYVVNLAAGSLKLTKVTRIPLDENVYIEYIHEGYSGFQIDGAVNYSIETSLILRGKNLVNNQRVEFYAPRAIVSPTSPVNFLSTELVKLDLAGTLSLYENQSPFTYKELGAVA